MTWLETNLEEKSEFKSGMGCLETLCTISIISSSKKCEWSSQYFTPIIKSSVWEFDDTVYRPSYIGRLMGEFTGYVRYPNTYISHICVRLTIPSAFYNCLFLFPMHKNAYTHIDHTELNSQNNIPVYN